MAEMRDFVVTADDAEDALTEVFEYLFALPDSERAFLAAGSRSCWPQIVRSVREGDYGDGQHIGAEIAPSPRLTRRMMARAERLLLGERAAVLAIPEGHRALVGRVIVMKRWPDAGGFRWERVWEREGGRRSGTTADALRMRFERAMGKLAARMTALGMGAEGVMA